MIRHALVAALLAPAPALACGGFFCETQPILQASERIVFAVGDDAIEAHVQIAYEGNARQFAWVVPAPEMPELFTSTDELFSRLDGATEPRFELEIAEEGNCLWPDSEPSVNDTDDAADIAAWDTGEIAVEGVTVVAREDVGPYDSSILQATDEDALLMWLNLNGYRLPGSYAEAMAPYLSDGFFVALRLRNDKDVGDLTPLGMRYAAPKAGIPMVLTSIAAVPDMRVDSYILGPSGAVPENYLHVQINEAAISWPDGGSNYEAVITEAANEAGGQAFATDFAGPTSSLPSDLFATTAFDLALLRDTLDPAAYADAMFRMGFPANTAVLELLADHIPMPQSVIDRGVDAETFYACVGCYADELTDQAFDPLLLTDALELLVVAPLSHADALLDAHPWITRLRSSFSPEEMTLDPSFVFNDGMGPVDNVHRARLVYECGDGLEHADATRRVEVADHTVRWPAENDLRVQGIDGTTWLEGLELSASSVIETTSADAPPVVVTDNRGAIDDRLLQANEGVPSTGTPTGCGCNGNGGLASVLWFAPLVLVRRRRR
jgi:hypothetical protein